MKWIYTQKYSYSCAYEVYIVIDFVLGIYKSGFSCMYLREYLTTPPIIEKRIMAKKI